ncbi:RIB43A-like with coiled-coils protein 2 [Centruroides sculpturatus]|uniref:RIB43A-like with coiled-coils protein 2 n=1 Tax=Centruroides sculpturatus TaxID=218467 RepID=UPI000C6E27E5|nr:RIB43A-like with coiled-coils protein 2 [Centruroides sculpturatus]XP_023209706.1 RIB43A-like with coiled-coils protein 2 [Centruroides sculpturatus]
MLNILDIPVDPKEEAKIRFKRIQEWQRKARIFNPKQRLIGVDLDSLNQQVRDRNKKEISEKLENEQFEKEMIQNDLLAVMLEKRKKKELRNYNEEINRYRIYNQYPQTRREYDLNDPDRLKKDKPPRISDDDPNLSVSGIQKLDGEDLNFKEKLRQQRFEFCKIIEEQIEENKFKKNYEDNMERLFYEQFRDLNLKAMELRKRELETRRQMKKNEAEFNKRLAEDIILHQRHEKLQEEQEKLQEIFNTFYSDMLTENPEVARSSFGPHRVIPDRWKGLSKEQLNLIYDTQKRQMIDDLRKKEMEEQEMAEWDKLILHQNRCAILKERELSRRKKRTDQNLCLMNHELAKEQTLRKEYLNKIVYTNPLTEDYFSQFNTTTR